MYERTCKTVKTEPDRHGSIWFVEGVRLVCGVQNGLWLFKLVGARVRIGL